MTDITPSPAIAMPPISPVNLINSLRKRRTNADLMDGWDKAEVAKLPEAEQEWLAQFFFEASGAIGSADDAKILSPDDVRDAWAHNKREQRALRRNTKLGVQHVEFLEVEDYPDNLDPEVALLIKERFELAKARKLARKEK